MGYTRDTLAQDEDVIWSNVDWSIPGGGAEAIYTPPSDWGNADWSNIDWTKGGGVQIPSQPPRPFPSTPQENYPYTTLPKSSDWWSGITGALVPLSTAAANVIRAITGQAPPAGSMYNPRTGQYVTPSSGVQQWIIPLLLLGGGILLITKKRR